MYLNSKRERERERVGADLCVCQMKNEEIRVKNLRGGNHHPLRHRCGLRHCGLGVSYVRHCGLDPQSTDIHQYRTIQKNLTVQNMDGARHCGQEVRHCGLDPQSTGMQ